MICIRGQPYEAELQHMCTAATEVAVAHACNGVLGCKSHAIGHSRNLTAAGLSSRVILLKLGFTASPCLVPAGLACNLTALVASWQQQHCPCNEALPMHASGSIPHVLLLSETALQHPLQNSSDPHTCLLYLLHAGLQIRRPAWPRSPLAGSPCSLALCTDPS